MINTASPIHYKLNTQKELLLLKYEDILYLEADGSYTIFHLSNGKIISATQCLCHIEKELPSFFFRCHRSFCVNLEHIIRIDKQNLNIIVSRKKLLQISKSKLSELIDLL